jgi:hypothetical protein
MKHQPTSGEAYDAFGESLAPPFVQASTPKQDTCSAIDPRRRHLLPLQSDLFHQLLAAFEVE